MRATMLVATIVLALFAFADDPPTPQTPPPPPNFGPAVFCEGQYALCIKAACSPIVTRNTDGTYSITQANCSCDVLDGWSMGPGTCHSRKPSTVNGRTYLVSTYSNFFNGTNLTLTCDNATWAWCYGSPCVVDEKIRRKPSVHVRSKRARRCSSAIAGPKCATASGPAQHWRQTSSRTIIFTTT